MPETASSSFLASLLCSSSRDSLSCLSMAAVSFPGIPETCSVIGVIIRAINCEHKEIQGAAYSTQSSLLISYLSLLTGISLGIGLLTTYMYANKSIVNQVFLKVSITPCSTAL